MTRKTAIVFAHGSVGAACLEFLLGSFDYEVTQVFVMDEDQLSIIAMAERAGVPVRTFSPIVLIDKADYGFLLWWPKIISKTVLSFADKFINLHPSLLPWNRGMNPYYWSIVEGTPYGVSIHLVTPGIDDGPLLAQREIPVSFTDTGQQIREKAQAQIVQLFCESLPKLDDLVSVEQPLNFRARRRVDMLNHSAISPDTFYRARDLINIIRARTFYGPGSYPASIEVDGVSYDLRIEIRRSDESN